MHDRAEQSYRSEAGALCAVVWDTLISYTVADGQSMRHRGIYGQPTNQYIYLADSDDVGSDMT